MQDGTNLEKCFKTTRGHPDFLILGSEILKCYHNHSEDNYVIFF